MSWIPNTQMAAGMKTAEAETQALKEALAHSEAIHLRNDAEASQSEAPSRRRRWLRRLQFRSKR